MAFLDFIPLIGSVASGLLGQTQSNLNYRQNLSLMDRQNLYNRQMADLTYQRGLEMWRLNNDYNENYNLPSNQIARLKDAGLNPALYYGSSSGSQSYIASQPHQSGYTPSVAIPQTQRYNLSNIGSGLSSGISGTFALLSQKLALQKQQSEIKLLDNQALESTLKLEAESPYYKDLAYYKAHSHREQWLQSQFDSELKSLETSYKQQTFNQLIEQFQLQLEQSRFITKQLQPKQLQELISRIKLIDVQKDSASIARDIDSILLNQGINLRGDGIERLIFGALKALESMDISMPDWLNAIVRGVLHYAR